MSLIKKLQAKGVKVYSGEPLWKQVEVLDTVKVGDNAVVTKSEKFGTYQLVLEDSNGRAYVSLKQGSRADQEEFQLVAFQAVRDWEEYQISEGDVKVFAV